MKPNEKITFSNYNIFTKNRDDGYGGVAILTKKNLIAKEIQSNDLNPIEFIEVQIKKNNLDHIFSAIYIPPNINNSYITNPLKTFFKKYDNKDRVYIGGDFNAHHNLWGKNARNTSRGNLVANEITNSNLLLLNDGNHTYQNINNHIFTAIDLSLISNDYATNVEWKIMEDNVGSDHLPILCEIGTNDRNNLTKIIKKVNIKKLMDDISTMSFENAIDIESYETMLQETIRNCTQTIQTKIKHTPKPWWTSYIEKLWLIKRNKQRIYFKNKTAFTATELKNSIANLKKEIKIQKENTWNAFIEDVNPNNSLKSVYKKINIFNPSKKKQASSSNFLDSNEKINELLQINYKSNFVYPNFNVSTLRYNNDQIDYNEIKKIIKDSKNTAPGINNISNQVLKILNDEQIIKLNTLLQNMWNNQKFPKHWHIIKAVAFVKPGKDPQQLENYRVISLLNVIYKIFNKYLKNKLNEIIDTNQLIPKNSFGFRAGVGTNEFAVNLVKSLEENKQNNYITAVVSIDLQKAFDNVNINKLISIMNDMGFDNKYLYWITQMLSNRCLKLDSNGKSGEICISEGVPQGDVLSPLLFNLYTAGIHELQNNNIQIIQYADDFTFLIKGEDSTTVNTETNRFLCRLQITLNSLNLNMNASKSKFMCHNFKNNFSPLIIRMSNEVIKEYKDLTILGITIDNKLKFGKHYRELKDKCSKFVNVLKIFNNKKGGAHPKTLLNAYNTLVKSRATFGSVATKNNSLKSIKSLQTVINASLRNVMGFTRSTPITAILGESCEHPFEFTQEKLNIKFICKHVYLKTDIGIDIKNKKSTEKLNETYQKFPLLEKICNTTKNTVRPSNLIIQENIAEFNKNKMPKENFNYAMETIQQYTDKFTVYTDASIMDKSVGVGIYFKNSEEKLKFKIKYSICIKTAEIFAIFMAVRMSISMGQRECIIYTDSKSSCISIKKSLDVFNNKLYENKIIRLLCINPNCNIIIQWIPAHIGISGNEIADALAKDAILTENHEIEISLPPEDIQRICIDTIHTHWEEEFKHRTQHKGKFNANILQTPKHKTWFHKSNLSNKQIKIINRLRSGHAYDKKFKHLMKFEDTNICDTCNIIEDAKHIIENCSKHNNFRSKYTQIGKKGLENILRNGKVR